MSPPKCGNISQTSRLHSEFRAFSQADARGAETLAAQHAARWAAEADASAAAAAARADALRAEGRAANKVEL